MRKLLLCLALCVVSISLRAQSTSQASDNNVVVGDAAQPVQWFHRESIKGAILAAQPNGTVWIPGTYTGTDCNPIAVCNPGAVLVIDLRSGQFNTTPTGSGTCGTCFSNIFGRSGPTLTANAGDYSVTGIAQQAGNNGTLNITKNALGTIVIGDAGSGNQLVLSPHTGFVGFGLSDVNQNSIFTEPAGGFSNNILLALAAGPTIDVKNNGTIATGGVDINLSGALTGGTGVHFTPTLSTFDMPINVPSCTGCGTTVFGTDQFQIGTTGGNSNLFSAVQGALAYNTNASGQQGLYQAGCVDLADGCNGTGQIVRTSGPSLTNPNINNATGSSLGLAGTGPTQWDMQYSGTAMNSPTASHSYWGVDSSGNAQISSNGGNYFHPGPSSAILMFGCGGTVGTTNSAAYIGWPANQSTTTCTATVTSATVMELPIPANGTLQNLYCVIGTAGITGDAIKVYVNGAATALVAANGTSGSANDTSDKVTVTAGQTWSGRYVVAGSGTETAAGWRCSMEYVRTP